MATRWLAACSCLLVLTFTGGPSAQAEPIDPHGLYEQRCTACHQLHAGEFVREALMRHDEKTVGRDTGKEIEPFLRGGHGDLAPAEIVVMVAHLTSIVKAGALFRRKCLICHDRAVVLARRELIQSNGRVVGRYTGRDIATFLENHGRLEGLEIGTVVQMLERQLVSEISD